MNPDERKEPPCVHIYIVTEWENDRVGEGSLVVKGQKAITLTCSKCLETKSL